MATVISTTGVGGETFSLFQSGQRRFSAADLAAMPTCLPSGSVDFELHHGRLVAMSPPGAIHGSLQLRIGAALFNQGELQGHGKAYSEVAVILDRGPDHVFGADAAFIAKRSLPARQSPEGYLETIPELIVEIRSKNDTTSEITSKVADYLKAGVQLTLVVEPDRESVTEHRSNAPPKVFHKIDSLTCEDIIPGFLLPLAELFKD